MASARVVADNEFVPEELLCGDHPSKVNQRKCLQVMECYYNSTKSTMIVLASARLRSNKRHLSPYVVLASYAPTMRVIQGGSKDSR
jgi:hypothetical protein